MDIDSAVVISRWLYFTSVTMVFGAALFPFYASDKEATFRALTLRRSVNIGLAVLASVSAALWLLCFSAGLAGNEGMVGTLRGVLLESSFGAVWLVRLSLALLLVAVSLSGRPALIVAPAFLLLACEGWQGHAALWGFAGAATQVLHVTSAAAWIGGLVPLGRLVATARRSPVDVARAAAVLLRFSRFGIVAVLMIAVTGVMNTWWMLGGFPDLSNSYGRVLLLKVGLFSAMVALAALNRRALIRDIATSSGKTLRTLSRNIALEQILGVGVLLDVSALGLMDPFASGAEGAMAH